MKPQIESMLEEGGPAATPAAAARKESSNELAGASGRVVLKTLLLTDLVASTRLVESLGDQRAAAVMALHDRTARGLLEEYGGHEIDKSDGFLLLFGRPADALGYALAYHDKLAELSEELGVELAARAGIHLGEVFVRSNSPAEVARGAKALEVEGVAKPMAARLVSLAGSRQTLLENDGQIVHGGL